MGLFVDELCSSEIVTHMLYKTALAIAIIRWVLSWAMRLRNRTSNDNNTTSTTTTTTTTRTNTFQSEDLSFSSSTQLIRDALSLTTFGEVRDRLPNCPWDTCAVCLSQFTPRDEVRELRNCCHVFHRECLDKWLDHDRQNQHDHHQSKTCPLCRSPFLTESQSQCLSLDSTRSQPSWAVERLLYLFGDDLLL